MRKVVACGGLIVVVGLLLEPGGVIPLFPGRPPSTSHQGPTDSPPPGGLTAGAEAFTTSQLYLDLGPEDSITGADVRVPIVISADSLDSFDAIAGLDRDSGENRPERSKSTLDLEQALASAALASIVLRALFGRRRSNDAATGAAAASLSAQVTSGGRRGSPVEAIAHR